MSFLEPNSVVAASCARCNGWDLLLLDGNPEFVNGYSNQSKHKYRIASD